MKPCLSKGCENTVGVWPFFVPYFGGILLECPRSAINVITPSHRHSYLVMCTDEGRPPHASILAMCFHSAWRHSSHGQGKPLQSPARLLSPSCRSIMSPRVREAFSRYALPPLPPSPSPHFSYFVVDPEKLETRASLWKCKKKIIRPGRRSFLGGSRGAVLATRVCRWPLSRQQRRQVGRGKKLGKGANVSPADQTVRACSSRSSRKNSVSWLNQALRLNDPVATWRGRAAGFCWNHVSIRAFASGRGRGRCTPF